MNSMTGWILRHRRLVAVSWIVIAAIGLVFSGSATTALSTQGSLPPGYEGADTNAIIARVFANGGGIALREVWAAVAGYLQPTLLHEIRGAREILSAAGIAFRHEGERIAVPSAVEAVLAWAVREGVTNVIKHSRATHCTVRVDRMGDSVQLELLDDGQGLTDRADSRWNGTSGGNGLEGLRERAAALGGRCEAGRFDGGFRLGVSLPLGDGDGPRSVDPAPQHTLAGAGTGDRT